MTSVQHDKPKTGTWLAATTAAWLLLIPVTTSAEQISKADVTFAVGTWVRHVTADAQPDAVIERLEPHVVGARTVGYIAHLQGGGYCLCGADDLVLPVYLYNPNGSYDATNPGYQYVLSEIAGRLQKLEESIARKSPRLDQYEKRLAERVDYWNDLIAGRMPEATAAQSSAAAPTVMTLRVNSYWDQGSPYNDQCPVHIPGQDDRCVVGCTATTASQIMYYWKWPSTGTGINSVEYDRRYRANWDYESLTYDPNLLLGDFWTDRLYWTPAYDGRLYTSWYWDRSIVGKAKEKCNGAVDCQDETYWDTLETLWDRLIQDPETFSASFGATTYDWSVMQDDHTDPPDAGDVEVAKLCHHAGIAVGMRYGKLASSAGQTRDGLVDYFRYDSDAQEIPRDVDDMVEDIQWLRPLEISGKKESGGGHSWTVCGYNKGMSPWQFLMNMGWGGGSTDWYSVDEVYPVNQWNTIRIAPEDGVKFVGGGSSGDGSPSSPISDLETAFDNVPDGTLLIMKAGSTHTLTATDGHARLDKPIKLTGHQVTIAAE